MLNDRLDPMHLNKSVLFLPSWYPNQQDPTHGIFIQNHAKALARFTKVVVVYAYSIKGTAVNEVTINEDGNLTEVRFAYPKTTITIPFAKHYSQFTNYVNAYKKLLQYLIDHNVSVSAIQVNVAFPASIVLNLFKDHFKVKHTLVEHWSGYLHEDGNYKGAILKRYTKYCFKNVSKVWYVSERQKQALIEHDLKGEFELLYNAVDTSVFKIDRKERKKKTTFLHVSSLVEREKNLKGTFEALKLLQDKALEFELIIIGGNAESTAETKILQDTIGVQHITYLGYQTKENISSFMNSCDALLLFSHFEGMPVVALEALACGLPVFASQVGQLPHLITDEFGRLSPVNDVQHFAGHLENFMNKNHNFNSEKMSQFISEHASFDAVGKQMWDFYDLQ
ncbi:MAG: glycosyltransferase [Bacteroidia bacterium]|jgi:L-malate glycosyltransferase|nr:glycosyltransferase [Bacteroidia bacterium]